MEALERGEELLGPWWGSGRARSGVCGCLCWGQEGIGCGANTEGAHFQGGSRSRDARWGGGSLLRAVLLGPGGLVVGGDSTPLFPSPPGSRSGAPSVPTLLCSISTPE